mgnify:CR=1 FL=1
MKVLLIGPVKPLVGGAAVVFDRLINSLEENPNVDLIVVSTYPGYKVNKVVYYFRRLLDFLFFFLDFALLSESLFLNIYLFYLHC